jgi:predicted porin
MRRAAWALFLLALANGIASAQNVDMPPGLSVSNQAEYAWGNQNYQPTLEDWMDLRYTSGAFTAGFRLVAFQPPDTIISRDRSSFQNNLRYVEIASDLGSIRMGNFYALFGQGLALNAYEQRDLRVDTSLEGVMGSGTIGGATLTILDGLPALGASEDAERRRGGWLQGADLEYAFGQTGVSAGASAVAHETRTRRTGERAKRELYAGRASFTAGPVYLYGEYARHEPRGKLVSVDDEPTGDGAYASGNVAVGPLTLLAEYKDYDHLTFRTSDQGPYNLPPALIREHTYTLLNRYPHVLDADDEKGFQVEGTLSIGGRHRLTGHYGETRNHDDEDRFNYFDEAYGELSLDLGEGAGFDNVELINALDYQKSFSSGLTADPYLRLYSNVTEARLVVNDRDSYRIQFEHQHAKSDDIGEYDAYFGLLDWSRSPNLSVDLVAETSNRTRAQLRPGEMKDALYGLASYHLSENHDVSVLYGRRLAGFVCVGGVCRNEPEFEGIEVRLLSRF